MLIFPEHLQQVFKRIREAYAKSETPILVLTAPDCDSMCATRIFVAMLKTEGITYQIEPVQGYGDVEKVKDKIVLPRLENEEMHSIVMINCGAVIDILTFFFGEMGDVPEELTFYLIDNHRPFHLNNIHCGRNVLVLEEEGGMTADKYPEPVEDMESEDEDEDGFFGDDQLHANSKDQEADFADPDGTDGSLKRKRLTKRSDNEARKKRKKLEMKEKQYYKMNDYGASSAGLLLRMAQSCTKEDNNMLWWAILGLTDLFIHDHCDRPKYNEAKKLLKQSVGLKNKAPAKDKKNEILPDFLVHTQSGEDLGGKGVTDNAAESRANGHIQESQEFRFFLMRHWTLYDSMFYSRYVASQMATWKEQGNENLDEMMVKLGLSMKETHCPFQEMATQEKLKLHAHMREYLESRKTGLFEEYKMGRDLAYESFTRQVGHTPTAAADLVHAVTALLEDDAYDMMHDQDITDEGERTKWRACFNKAYDCLASTASPATFDLGIQSAIRRQRDMVTTGCGLIEKDEIRTYPYLRCATINQKSNFTTPLALCKLALFTVDAFACTRKNYVPKPFVLAALIDANNSYLVAGVPSRRAHENKSQSCFNKAFRAAVTEVKARFRHDGFEASVIEVQRDDLKKFQEHLYMNVVDHM